MLVSGMQGEDLQSHSRWAGKLLRIVPKTPAMVGPRQRCSVLHLGLTFVVRLLIHEHGQTDRA